MPRRHTVDAAKASGCGIDAVVQILTDDERPPVIRVSVNPGDRLIITGTWSRRSSATGDHNRDAFPFVDLEVRDKETD